MLFSCCCNRPDVGLRQFPWGRRRGPEREERKRKKRGGEKKGLFWRAGIVVVVVVVVAIVIILIFFPFAVFYSFFVQSTLVFCFLDIKNSTMVD